jgi:hypothetical protein
VREDRAEEHGTGERKQIREIAMAKRMQRRKRSGLSTRYVVRKRGRVMGSMERQKDRKKTWGKRKE